jgi:hypothetical protein
MKGVPSDDIAEKLGRTQLWQRDPIPHIFHGTSYSPFNFLGLRVALRVKHVMLSRREDPSVFGLNQTTTEAMLDMEVGPQHKFGFFFDSLKQGRDRCKTILKTFLLTTLPDISQETVSAAFAGTGKGKDKPTKAMWAAVHSEVMRVGLVELESAVRAHRSTSFTDMELFPVCTPIEAGELLITSASIPSVVSSEASARAILPQGLVDMMISTRATLIEKRISLYETNLANDTAAAATKKKEIIDMTMRMSNGRHQLKR